MSQSIDDSTAARGGGAVSFAEAPLRSPVMGVEPHWIDYNGHLNVAWYEVLFGRGIDALFGPLGLGSGYRAEREKSMFALEAHLFYIREINQTDRVAVDNQILDHDAKRIHIFQTLVHAEGGHACATREIMQLHVDMATRRSAPFPDDIMARVAACAAAHAGLPRPEHAGRSIGIRRR